ncbi:hypothetical protein LX66_0372 [Chitinophaga japonensis]|uniref:Uncharacterized protein n=1 Tax=Chitinophaga japonensis TaxID=104662 RepID=A0A562TBS1_CHIJA|nr:hypothetical protein LX66_0372 [Chitinophaga japonensis]
MFIFKWNMLYVVSESLTKVGILFKNVTDYITFLQKYSITFIWRHVTDCINRVREDFCNLWAMTR